MLDIEELDQSLKIRSLGRLLETNHPFLQLIKNRLNMGDFLFPSIDTPIDKPTSVAVSCIRRDRLSLLGEEESRTNRKLIGLFKDSKIENAISTVGKTSVTYLLIRRAGKRTLGELNLREIDRLAPFLNTSLVIYLKDVLNVAGAVVTAQDKDSIWVSKKLKPLSNVTSKAIRLSRTAKDPICVMKSGTILLPSEAVNYFYNLNKLSAVKHKNILLKIHHGDIYTRDRLFRFGLADSPQCPRCDEIEDLEHKFITCVYANKVWKEIDSITGLTVATESIQNRLLATDNLNPTLLTIHSEILYRINGLRPNATYLVHPKAFALKTIEYLAKTEKQPQIKNNLENFIED